jgi:hypothetical protein
MELRGEPASDRATAGAAAERGWEELTLAMSALGAAEPVRSKALYRTAAGVVLARAAAFQEAMQALLRLLEE